MRSKKRIALVGTHSLQGKEIKSALDKPDSVFTSVDFFDADVEEEYSRLTQFRGEPKVVHPLKDESLLGADLVFLAAETGVNRRFGEETLKKQDCLGIDLSYVFNRDPGVPVIVNGINDKILTEKKPRLVANPHPVTIMLSHFFDALLQRLPVKRSVAFVLQPVSVFGEDGIQELAEQSVALLNGTSLPRKVFKDQVAFNFLLEEEQQEGGGFSPAEIQIADETCYVLNRKNLPLCLALVQAPVFHTYSVTLHVETDKKVEKEEMKKMFTPSSIFKWKTAGRSASPISVAGKNKIHVGPVKIEQRRPGCMWFWLVADNLTRGSALNALEVAEKMLA